VVQRLANGSATQLPAGLALRTGTGQRLPEAVQRKMETLFGARFDDVRIHVGAQAASIGAVAFTHGTDIYFAPGRYDPASPHGQRLLGHELTHVVQQRAGRARNPFGAGLAVLQDRNLEAEAERMGLRAAQAPPPAAQPAAAVQRSTGPRILAPPPVRARRGVLQRVREEDLQALSMLFTGYQVGMGSDAGEIQAMYIDSNVVVASNQSSDIAEVKKLFQASAGGSTEARMRAMHERALAHREPRRYSSYDFLFAGISNKLRGAPRAELAETFVDTHLTRKVDTLLDKFDGVLSAATASACAGLLDTATNKIILLTSDQTLHAEQQLLKVLAYRLESGRVPTHLGIRGVRKPCTKCHTVLRAFAAGYQKTYNKTLAHLEVGESTEAQMLDLKADFRSSNATFNELVEIFDEIRTPSRYRFDLRDYGAVARAAAVLRDHLSVAGFGRAKDQLLSGYDANRAGSFRVSYLLEDTTPILFDGGPGAAKDRNLSALLTALSVAHEAPPLPVLPEASSSRPQPTITRRNTRQQEAPQERAPPNRLPTAPRNVPPQGGGGGQQGGWTWGQIAGWGLAGTMGAVALVTGIMSLMRKEDPARPWPAGEMKGR
jgi:hypothetical protein